MPLMTQEEIKKIIPHRDPFLLIDTIEARKQGKAGLFRRSERGEISQTGGARRYAAHRSGNNKGKRLRGSGQRSLHRKRRKGGIRRNYLCHKINTEQRYTDVQ